MARMIKSVKEAIIGLELSTVFENGDVTSRIYKVGDEVENLRYVEDQEIKVVSGRITAIKYSTASRATWNRNRPTNTLVNDITLTELVIDNSEHYQASTVTVPMTEIVEFANETDVKRMKFAPFIELKLALSYSDLSSKEVLISIGDTFDNVVVMDPQNVGTDITGKFKIVAFAYRFTNKLVDITGLALENAETGVTIVTDLEYVFKLNELYNYVPVSASDVANMIASLQNGDTLQIKAIKTENGMESLSTVGNPVAISGKEVAVELDDDIIADNSSAAGLQVLSGAKVELTGSGKIISTTPYDSSHSTGAIQVRDGGELVLNGSGLSAVVADDPVNKGQFGVCVFGPSKVTMNDGDIKAGWYGISGNGTNQNTSSEIEINAGAITSVADYAIYHPQKGKLTINGGVIDGAAGAICMNSGDLVINAGRLQSFGTGDTGSWSDGTGGLGNAVLNLAAKYGPVTCVITGGTFATSGNAILIATGTKYSVDIQISGGNFSSKPDAAWIAEGYVCTEEPDDDGFYTVVPAPITDGE